MIGCIHVYVLVTRADIAYVFIAMWTLIAIAVKGDINIAITSTFMALIVAAFIIGTIYERSCGAQKYDSQGLTMPLKDSKDSEFRHV